MTVSPESRREQLRNAAAMCRRRRKHGLLRRSINLTKAQLDALEVKGYLDPDLRGNHADEAEGIETFLMDSLGKR
jgi:hypothetical protein